MKKCVLRCCSLLLALLIPVASAMPVGAAAQNGTGQDRILSLYISTSEEDGNIPLANIILDIYRGADLKQLENGEIRLDERPSAKETERYRIRANLVATLMTDTQGCAEFNLTQAGQPDGVYLIAEQPNPAMAGEPELRWIAIDGSSREVHLEKVAEKAPHIQMDVSTVQQKSGSFDIGQFHTWLIRSDIPAGICNARSYTVTDVLDHRLSYETGSAAVSLFSRDGTEILLEKTHYTCTEETQTRNGTVADAFRIALTSEGMTYIASKLGSGIETPQLYIRFRAAINRNTAMGATIPNDAHLDYVNSAGVVYHADSDIPEVHTGAINILKTDREGLPLAGSDFMIAREATQAEMEDETIAKEVLHVGSKNLAVVYVDFYTAETEGGKRFTVTTDAEGKASICGLSFGTYYLVESKAPEGYDRMLQPMEVEINEVSHLTQQAGRMDANGQPVDNTLKIVNTKFVFPDTGGTGTAGFTAAGVMLICAACFLLFSNRSRKY